MPQLLGYRLRWAGQLWKVDVYGSKVGHYREGGCQLPFRRLVEGPRKANSGCSEGLPRVYGGVLASSGKLMCMPQKLAIVEGGQLPFQGPLEAPREGQLRVSGQ